MISWKENVKNKKFVIIKEIEKTKDYLLVEYIEVNGIVSNYAIIVNDKIVYLTIPNIGDDISCYLNVVKNTIQALQEESDNTKEINDFFEQCWKEYPKEAQKGKSTVKLAARKRLLKVGFEKIKSAINEYKKDKDLEVNGGYKKYMQGSTFFNNRYKEFINDLVEENIVSKQQVNKIRFVENEL